MKVEQAFIAEVNFLKRLDTLIDDIEGFDTDQAIVAGVKKFTGGNQPEEEEKEDSIEKMSQESETLGNLYKIIKSKKSMRIKGVVVDIFAAVILMVILKRLSPVKREILLTLPIKQVLKYAIKNIDKVFTKF